LTSLPPTTASNFEFLRNEFPVLYSLKKEAEFQLYPDPADETASALLERFHAEPAAPVKGKRRRKARVPADAPLFE